MVRFTLLDYGGVPLPDLPFTLTLKKKGALSLKTDANGQCLIPKEWFVNKEKMRVNFTVTPEYQASHDLHDKRKK